MKLRIAVAAILSVIGGFAQAADLPLAGKVPPYVAAQPMYNWSGLWIGIRGGYGVNSTNVATLTDGVSTFDIGSAPKGFVGGGDAGIDFQFSPAFVGGIYVEQDFADLRNSANLGSVSLANLTNYLGAAGVRFGYLVTPTTLLFVKGGFAWVGAHPEFSRVGTTQAITDTSFGYEIGGGLEHKLGGNWSVKIEYDHTHAGDKQIPISEGLSSIAHYTIDKGMVGISYKLF